jgi:hypothetical protein
MKARPRLRNFDDDVWRIATWAAPFTVQVVLGVAIAISWLLGKYVSNLHGFAQYTSGMVATLLLSAAVSAPLFMSASPRARGVAISIVGSFVVSVVGGVLSGFWIVAW